MVDFGHILYVMLSLHSAFKITLLSSHWYNVLMRITILHIFTCFEAHPLYSNTDRIRCTRFIDWFRWRSRIAAQMPMTWLCLTRYVFFRAFDGGTFTMVALLNTLKRLGARDSSSDSSLFQLNEAKASGVDARNIDGFVMAHILFNSFRISRPRMVSTCVRIFWSPIACRAIASRLRLPTLLPRRFSDRVRWRTRPFSFTLSITLIKQFT